MEDEAEKDKRRAELLTPENLQRLLADALTYKSSLRDLTTIVKCGADVNGVVKRGLRPLHYAVHAGNIEGVNFLLDNGADVNSPDDIGYRPVHLCARKGLLEPLRLLIDRGAQIDFFVEPDDWESDRARNLGYLTIEPLNMALENNHEACARLLLERGAKPNNQYFLGYEINLLPLDNLECLKTLLEFGADPNLFSRCGLSPLMKACRQHNIRAARILMDSGASLDIQPPDRFEQKTAIHYAIMAGSNGIANALLRRGAAVARPPGYKYSALHTAVLQDKPDMCELLIRWDARLDEATDEESTPLQLACAAPGLKNRLEIVQVLLRHGADPNANSRFVSYSSPFLAPLTEYLRWGVGSSGSINWDTLGQEEEGEERHQREEVRYPIVRALLLHGAKVHFCAASTSSRAKDPHGILHSVHFLEHAPEVFRLLVSAATKVDVESVQAYSSLTEQQRKVLLAVGEGPRDLRTIVHLFLRDYFRPNFPARVASLPLPEVVKRFLLFNPPRDGSHVT